MAGAITPEHWNRISELFEAALELDADRRTAFLDKACSNDAELRAWVLRLLSQHEQLGAFMQNPLSDRGAKLALDLLNRPTYEKGELLAHRFEIARFIGQGGMGEVYEAWDKELGERVALKVIRKEFAADDATLARFHREIRLARRITHPNVCRVFDLVRHELPSGQSAFFYVMELLAGETLAARLSRGPIPLDEGAALAGDMAQGLDAAHHAGVIHRDFKPGNVMLVQSEHRVRAVITDFGLAMSFGTESLAGAATQTGKILGTPGYMAPEQIVHGAVSKAVDIYAFGVVLREMAGMPVNLNEESGRKLFPANWIRVVRQCTALDPAQRFTSASEACRLLAPRWPARVMSRRKMASLAGAGAVAASLPVAVSRLYQRWPKWKLGARVVLSKTQNLTDEPWLDAFASSLRVQLGQSAHLNLVELSDVEKLLAQIGAATSETQPQIAPQVWREVAWRCAADVLVFSAISKIGVNYGLMIEYELRGTSPTKPAASSMRSFSARDRAALMTAAGEGSAWIRSEAGEPARSIAQYDRLPEDVSTPSWEALSYYARAENALANYKYTEALTLLDTALARDPQFTLAATRKGDVLMSLQEYDNGLQQWRKAIGMLQERSVTRREEVYVRGMYAYDTGDLPAAQRNFEAWALEFPQDWRGFFYQTIPLLLDGHAADAVRNLQRVVTLNPQYNRTWAQLANCYIALGDWRQAGNAVQKLRDFGESDHANFKEASLLFARGDTAGARNRFQALQKSANPGWKARGHIYEAVLNLEMGDYSSAAASFHKDVDQQLPRESDTYRSHWRLVLAFAYARLNNSKAAYEHARSALEFERGPYVLAHAGALFARTGHAQAAEQLAAGIQDRMDVPKYAVAAHKISGEVARLQGNRGSAIRHFEQASALDPRLSYRTYLASVLAEQSPRGDEARDLYRQVAQTPWLVFLDPMRQEPGVLGDSKRALERM
jgi:tetratricopeptide (TPR) repeat protein/tRNA A-37 threonylcarbamoyl transferase component Bud32